MFQNCEVEQICDSAGVEGNASPLYMTCYRDMSYVCVHLSKRYLYTQKSYGGEHRSFTVDSFS